MYVKRLKDAFYFPNYLQLCARKYVEYSLYFFRVHVIGSFQFAQNSFVLFTHVYHAMPAVTAIIKFEMRRPFNAAGHIRASNEQLIWILSGVQGTKAVDLERLDAP